MDSKARCKFGKRLLSLLAPCPIRLHHKRDGKGQHSVFGVRLHGQGGDADQQGVARAQRELSGIIEKYRPEDVFNIDETGLF